MALPQLDQPPTYAQAVLQRAELFGPLFTQILIIIICSVVLLLGTSGDVLVSESALLFREGYVGFAVGIAVQIALIAPLELCRTICKLWFWKQLVARGENLRSLLCTWSVIYSNSYRGAEDLLQGIGRSFEDERRDWLWRVASTVLRKLISNKLLGPISGLLMLVYVTECAILGAIGSLYTTVDVVTLKAQGELPIVQPFQSLTKDTDDVYADEAIIPAALSFFSFAKLYDPLVIQGIETNTTCEPATGARDDTSVVSAMWTGCATVVASPLTTPRLAIAKSAAPSAIDWATIVEGDILRSRATEITTFVDCGPSDDLALANDGLSYFFVWNGTVSSTTAMWAASSSIMNTPQVSIETLGTGSINENPQIDETGAMLFAVLAFNFDDLGNMTRFNVPLHDKDYGFLSETREVGAFLCSARVDIGTVAAEYEILQVNPGLVARLNYANGDSDRIPYSMDPSTPYGYSLGIFFTEALYIFTCDYLPCPTDSKDPPIFDQTIGLADAQPPAADGTVSNALNFTSMTTNLARLFSRNLLGYTTAPRYPQGIPANLLSTHAELWQVGNTKQIFTTVACNIILSIGIFCACALVTINLLQQTNGAMGGSVLQLLDAVGWRKMPNVTPDEWRAAGITKLRQHARHVLVKGELDSTGKVQLSMSSEKKLANMHILSDAEQLTDRAKTKPGGKAELGESAPPASQRVANMEPGEV
ncbi:hypothetical protein HDU87_007592 [Geranomyces variabilis]|uniref:Uncharacterized protein n=1 Tax=Geranomyces variabilis TaxID=109894 RepID=A0AAD5TDY9_9FUNG|nr:hypothetical protein HDU87_007592 [Geranomyces variabilis]